jgi:hypothetical protein
LLNSSRKFSTLNYGIYIPAMKLIAPAPGTRLAQIKYDYSPKPLLTPVEARFFNVLKQISGERVHIVCKPRLADLIDHVPGQGGFQSISQKHVDFLVCRPDDWMPMLAIEVDDSSHERKDRRARDWFVNNLFAHVGVPLLRVPVQEVENLELLVKRLSDGWDNRCRHLAFG